MNPFEKWAVLSTSLLTAVTGVGYFCLKYLLEPAEPWAVINHPLQPWLLKAHILVAPLLVFAVGMISVRHVWQHFRRRVSAGRRSGLTAGLSLVPMVLTGYLIQAITAEGWLLAIAVAHIIVSLTYSAGVGVHAVVAARRPAPPAAPRPAENHPDERLSRSLR
jgi:hypothetical protein